MKLNLGVGRPSTDAAALIWHPYFAWKPVYIAPYDFRWLETVERKAGWIGASGTWYDVKYRPMSNKAIVE